MSAPRLGRFFAVDPLAIEFPWNSPYAFSENRVVDGVELEGLEWENFMSKFYAPGSLKIKRPTSLGQSQHFGVTIKNPTTTFQDMKNTFKSTPEKYLTNSKATFNSPVDKEGNSSSFVKGSYIFIEINLLLNNGYVKVEEIKEEDSYISAKFVTLEGHVEKGEIEFELYETTDGNIHFNISSISEVDQMAAKLFESTARSEQTKSWQEVLDNIVEESGGEEVERKRLSKKELKNKICCMYMCLYYPW
ncbi:MAG: DUF1990 domain-containing protein [Flavobacteriales bacterium]|jgi:uncharacterized protein (UPF0548 family)|nr:DUF1990 domain-containing protein [Flavobacteriales bacterium]